MTSRPASNRRFAIAAVACHAAIAAWCIATTIHRSGVPGNYYPFRHGGEGFVYPTHEVVRWCVTIGLELAVAAWILLRSPSLAGASLALGLVSGLCCFVLAPFVTHAPPYFVLHAVFLLLSAAWLGLVGIVAGLASLVSRARARRREARETRTPSGGDEDLG